MASSNTTFHKVAIWNQIIPQSQPSDSDLDAGSSRSHLQLQAELYLWRVRWATLHKGTWPWSRQPLWEEPRCQHNLSKRVHVAKAKHLCFSDIFINLSRGSDTFPDTEVAEDPTGQKTQSQLPTHAAHLLYSPRQAQHSSSEQGNLTSAVWSIIRYILGMLYI